MSRFIEMSMRYQTSGLPVPVLTDCTVQCSELRHALYCTLRHARVSSVICNTHGTWNMFLCHQMPSLLRSLVIVALLAFGYFETYTWTTDHKRPGPHPTKQNRGPDHWTEELHTQQYRSTANNLNMAVWKRNGISKLRAAICSWHIHLDLIVFDNIGEKDSHNK